MSSNKKVAEESAIVGTKNNEELMARLIRETTSTVLSELIPLIQQGAAPRSDKEVQQSVKQVKERVTREMNAEFDRVVKENREFMTKLARAPKSDYRSVRIPQVYRKYFGSQLVVGLNGSFVTVPVDGRSHRVHKDFYSIIMRKLDYEDNKISHMQETDFSDVFEADRDSLGN